MNKNIVFISIVIVFVVGIITFIIFRAQVQKTPSPLQSQQQQTGSVTTSEQIVFTEQGYAPLSLVVPLGSIVTFVNKSAQPMWPASAMHPTHSIYPTAGGCIGSTFDACAQVLPEGTWAFTFDQKGTWKYHDHLNPRFFGQITVE